MTQDCEPVECSVDLVSVDIVEKIYVTKKCETQSKQIAHKKTRQVPKTVSKKLCNTLWKINDEGEKVWAGEDQCQEVEWQVFEEEEYDAVLNTTEVVCTDDAEIPYSSCQQTELVQDQLCFQCKAVAQPVCNTISTEMCGSTEVENCQPTVLEPECDNSGIRTPNQEFFHQEKCLFDQSGKIAGSPTDLENASAQGRAHNHHHHP